MAGLWDRVSGSAEDRINVHLIIAAFKAFFVNSVDATKGATAAQILVALNNELETPLTTAEEDDLTAIGTALNALANNTLKLIYLANLEYTMIAGELELINEAKWRNDLEI